MKSVIMPAMLRAFAFLSPCVLWIFLMRDFVFCRIPVNMDTNAIYGDTKYYFNNLLNGVIPLWEPFVSLGRHFYAIAICNLFNPATQLVPLLKLAGISYAQAFVVYMVVYFFIGCSGFYFLAREVLKDRHMAYLAYLGMMFSSLGASMFTQLTFLELLVPTIWFFFFLLRFSRRQDKGNFLGLTFSVMILISSYLPFYFMTVFFSFLLVFVFLYTGKVSGFCGGLYHYILKHWRLVLLCLIGILLAAAPLLAYKIVDGSGEVVAPGRHCQYSSAQQCYDRTMGRQGGMAYEEIIRSGTLGERLDMQYLFGNLDKITYGSDSLFFLPVWIYILLGLSIFLPLKRLTLLLCVMIVLIGLIAAGNAAGLLGFLYRHIFFFAYFRNLFFFGAFLIPMVILLALYQLQLLLQNRDVTNGVTTKKKILIVGMVALHGLLFFFLKHFEGVPAVSYATLGASALALIVYYSGILKLSPRIWTGFFALLLIFQPAWILKAYAANAVEFRSFLPSMHVRPGFAWMRPEKPAVNSSRIYQFVPYEDFWYETSMTDAPAKVGFPQSTIRWTFDLSEHTAPDVLARYARYKIVLYDNDDAARAQPQTGPSTQLDVSHFDVNSLELKTDFTAAKMLVYNDSYTSSWKADLDGKPIELLRANGAFKGVHVPAGPHTLAFRYHPPGGGWVYIIAAAGLMIFMLATILVLFGGG